MPSCELSRGRVDLEFDLLALLIAEALFRPLFSFCSARTCSAFCFLLKRKRRTILAV